jgi:hypothetical protein
MIEDISLNTLVIYIGRGHKVIDGYNCARCIAPLNELCLEQSAGSYCPGPKGIQNNYFHSSGNSASISGGDLLPVG